jgi:hypothetical protein
MIHTAIRVMQDNVSNYVSPSTDPVMFNVTVALLNIAKTLLKFQNQLDEIQHRLNRLEVSVAQLNESDLGDRVENSGQPSLRVAVLLHRARALVRRTWLGLHDLVQRQRQS